MAAVVVKKKGQIDRVKYADDIAEHVGGGVRTERRPSERGGQVPSTAHDRGLRHDTKTPGKPRSEV